MVVLSDSTHVCMLIYSRRFLPLWSQQCTHYSECFVYLPSQHCSLQICLSMSGTPQSSPVGQSFSMHSRLRSCVPPPHVTVHIVQGVQSPSSGGTDTHSTNTQSECTSSRASSRQAPAGLTHTQHKHTVKVHIVQGVQSPSSGGTDTHSTNTQSECTSSREIGRAHV